MRKSKYLFLAISYWLLANSYVVNANPVTLNRAQTVAVNFYTRNFKSATPKLTLAYTENSTDGQPVYYVFNVNTNDGFVIVSAEDAAHPILGYSNKGKYVIPESNSNIAWWMNCRKKEIVYARTKSMTATPGITNEWTGYINNTRIKSPGKVSGSGVGPLCTTAWDQPYPYSAMCPGGSVTGCVATAMAQIMKYWQYPSHGHGYNFYWDEQAYSYQNNFGYLSADYDTSHYVWSAMPDTVTSANNEVAELMYDCGVSVDMDYSLWESGSWVITGDYPVCSQTAYVKYFGYNPATIQGLYDSNYTSTEWANLIENELNNGRVVQYVGWDSISASVSEGHTWVCDGYDASGNFDMNWGWSGADDGPFVLNALDAGGYQLNWWDEILIGIEPPATSPYFSASPTFGCANLTVHFADSSIANAPVTSYKWLFPGGNPATSADTNPTVVYNTPGTYDVTEIVSDANGTDTLVRKAYISVASTANIPVAQGFESPTFPPAGWAINNPNNYSYTWQLNTNTGGYGKSAQCMYFNNCQGYDDFAPPGKAALDIIGQRQQIYTPEYNFTGTTNPAIYFDVAYAPYEWFDYTNYNLLTFSDTLAVYYSTDCGTTFTQVYLKGGLTLGTTGGYVTADTNSIGCFLPSSNEWRTDTIHIPAIAGASSVMFSFENRSGNGSPLYIDNLNITGLPTGVPNISSNSSIEVYPNPSNGVFTFGITNNEQGIMNIEVYNVLGEKVYSQFPIPNSQFLINLSSQPSGVYIYRVFSENGSAIFTGKLVIE